jgi:flagellar capping protein FliD
LVNNAGTLEWKVASGVIYSNPSSKLSGDAFQTLSNYEELDNKTRALNTLLNESLSKIEELEKRLNEQQELINRQFELIKKLEENK